MTHAIKSCTRCGASYTREEWGALPLVGHSMGLELRNCRCPGHAVPSTLAVEMTDTGLVAPPWEDSGVAVAVALDALEALREFRERK